MLATVWIKKNYFYSPIRFVVSAIRYDNKALNILICNSLNDQGKTKQQSTFCYMPHSLKLWITFPQSSSLITPSRCYVYTYTHWMVIHVHFSRSNATKKNGVTFRILKKKTDLNLILITGQTDHRKQVNYKCKSGPTTHFT